MTFRLLEGLALSNRDDLHLKEQQMVTLNVPDMTCGHCAKAVTEAVKSVDSNAAVNVDLETKTVQIDSQSADAAVIQALDAAGYPSDVKSA
ncbi:heavy-metal-associated domain-containing protein [Nitratireductor sp. OM-1]|uniref:heavy-metal-associated domain-containing protein n=1 Tax=Nitratireductor sp. OM-1 TaxID=1756988 RepID=UPI00352C3975